MSDWYIQERARRQALRQETNVERKYVALRARFERLLAAASATVKIEP